MPTLFERIVAKDPDGARDAAINHVRMAEAAAMDVLRANVI